ncbi:MAG TPA: S53 family peptidase [Solirubrobacteraceae bacterium]|nr:S53 family peptidase [Solirubrobacteraceae bacterium]
MTSGKPHIALALVATAAGLLALAAPVQAAATLSPLPASDYRVSPACGVPAPGEAGCLALRLIPVTAQARARTHPLGIARAYAVPAPSPAAGSFGLRPQDLHSAYALPTSAPSTQTVAIVDAYNDPTAESDLASYDEEFGLPACTAAGGCFGQVNQSGEASSLPFPKSALELEEARKGTSGERAEAERATGWALEISLDIEAAHATCQSCHILLVEARSAYYQNLEAAEHTAELLGAQEISNSWGAPELGMSAAQESTSAFDDPGIVITASAGDSGYLGWDSESPAESGYAEFPASSPHVVAVGGTRLSLAAGGAWQGETVWNGRGAGGGGCSVEFTAPPWQQSLGDWQTVGCGSNRAVADVSADADPYTGLAVHDTSPLCEHEVEGHVVNWCTIGGTSLASPLIASVFALAGGPASTAFPARTLYENELAAPGSLHDITTGSNGECTLAPLGSGESGCTAGEEASVSCASALICLAASGYDGPSGVGTPNGLAAFQPRPGAGGGGGGGGRQPVPIGLHPIPSPPAGGGAAVAPPALRLSGLTLTVRALIALNRGSARLSQVGFAVTVNTGASLRATLAERVRVHRRGVWRTLPGALTFWASSGRNSRNLAGRRVLRHGLYRLTLTAAQGQARAIEFQIG